MKLRVCPPMILKLPPAKTFPSDCTAIVWTLPFEFGSHESAAPVVASSRAMALRACPPMIMKSPPAKTLPSACTAIEKTSLFEFGLKAVSSVPSGFSRAMRLRATAAPPLGERVVKLPPIRILPSGWTTTTKTVPFAFGSKPSSAFCARADVARQTINANAANINTLPTLLRFDQDPFFIVINSPPVLRKRNFFPSNNRA